MEQHQQQQREPNEYDILLAAEKASSSPARSSYAAAALSASPVGLGLLAHQHHHLSTVLEEASRDLLSDGGGRRTASINSLWTTTTTDEKEQEHVDYTGFLIENKRPNQSGSGSLSSANNGAPNIHVKRGCRLWITFGFLGIFLFLFGGLPLERRIVQNDMGNFSIHSSSNNNAVPYRHRFAGARYDYIVIGGGPSGILTAVKLARKFPHLSVLLLESGTASQSDVLQTLSTRPGRSNGGGTRGGRSINSGYCPVDATSTTELNKFDIPLLWSGVASSQSRREVYGMPSSSLSSSSAPGTHLWPLSNELLVGRTLGGGGLLNAMVYVRSLRTDWERWNIPGWTFDDVLGHYLALERYSQEFNAIPSFYNNTTTPTKFDDWRGTRGPITTMAAGYGTDNDSVGSLFVQSALQAGIPLAARGFNHIDPARRVGAGMYEFNIRDGTRDSVAQALLGGGRPMPANLRIRTGHTVTRILTDSTSYKEVRAMGIAFQMSNGEMGEFVLTDAAAQVIVAAGAILTPQLLGQSGIGPGGHVLDLPGVGANCQDHPVVALEYEISPELARDPPSIFTVGDELEDYSIAADELRHNLPIDETTSSSAENDPRRLQMMSRLGTFGTPGFSAGAFLRSPFARQDDPSPDIQVTVFPRVIEPHVTRENKRQEVKFMHSSVMLATVALLDADARYIVNASVPVDLLRSGGDWVEFEAPRLQLAHGRTSYLSPRDVKRLTWGIQEVRKIMDTPPLASEIREEIVPGPSIREDNDVENYVRTNFLPNAHWIGTTRMGSTDDPMAVVDERLLVRGMANLRIVDAGVLPGPPNGNIHSTVTAVASRAADLIAKDRTEALSK